MNCRMNFLKEGSFLASLTDSTNALILVFLLIQNNTLQTNLNISKQCGTMAEAVGEKR